MKIKKTFLDSIITISWFFAFMLSGFLNGINMYPEMAVDTTPIIHVAKEIPLPDSTIKMIEKKAQARGFDIKLALRIAQCESQLGKFKKNWEGSSATGLFQFMPNTFKDFCKGDINSDEDQTDCFMNLYPKYAGMWECK